MTAVAAAAPARAWVARVTAAIPILTVFAWLCLVYGFEAWLHKTPWLFTDELELTQLSRAIAETGHAARRGEPHAFNTLYTSLLAPVWWAGSTQDAYAIAKYVGAAVMTSVVFPTYWLARLVVSPRPALFAAAGAGAIPAFLYASMFVPEPLAYPYAALCLFLIAKALAARGAWWIGGAAVASAVAPLVRSELGVIPAVYVLAALFLWWTGERMRGWRATWSAWDWAGAVTLIAGVLVVVNAIVTHRSFSWYVATTLYKDRMLDYGLWAVGALTIGLGVLPLVAGLAALAGRRGERRSTEERAFVAVAAASVIGFGWYTAVKAAYVSTVFSTLVEERNLIYVAPVLFVGTALFLERPRLRPLAVLGAGALALYVVLGTDYKIDVHLYSDAPGLSILQWANRNLGLTHGVAQVVLGALVAATLAVLLAPLVLRRRSWALRALLAVTATFVLAWNLTGQITTASASKTFSDQLLTNYPRPLDWLDRVTGGERTMYLGQQITDANGLWMLEFWNKSLRDVWSLDGSAKGPGPTLSPDLLSPDGRITTDPEAKYVVVDPGVVPYGRFVGSATHLGGGAPAKWSVYRIEPPLRLVSAATGIYADGWTGKTSAYSRYRTPGGRPGLAVVTVSRAAWGGDSLPGHVTIRVGPLRVKDKQPALARVTQIRRWTVHSKEVQTFSIPTPPPPFRVEVLVAPTFVPARYDANSTEMREFGAQVHFGFQPSSR